VLTVLLGQSTDKHHRFIDELISGQLDADKMDYLLRDSHYCGVQYGMYDIEKLINSLTICPSKYDQWQLGITTDGVHVVEEFVFARYWMFLQVYFHKTRRIYDYYLSNAIAEKYSSGYPKDLNEYLKINDIKIIESLNSEAACNSKWAKAYFSRPHLKEAFVSKPHQEIDEEKDRVAWVIQRVEEEFKDKVELQIDQAKGKSAKSLIDISKYLEEAEDSTENEREESLPAIPVINKYTGRVFPIQSISVPIVAISDQKINVLRVYTTDDNVEKVRNFCHRKFYEEYFVYSQKIKEMRAALEKDEIQRAEREKKWL